MRGAFPLRPATIRGATDSTIVRMKPDGFLPPLERRCDIPATIDSGPEQRGCSRGNGSMLTDLCRAMTRPKPGGRGTRPAQKPPRCRLNYGRPSRAQREAMGRASPRRTVSPGPPPRPIKGRERLPSRRVRAGLYSGRAGGPEPRRLGSARRPRVSPSSTRPRHLVPAPVPRCTRGLPAFARFADHSCNVGRREA